VLDDFEAYDCVKDPELCCEVVIGRTFCESDVGVGRFGYLNSRSGGINGCD
jgi:hypothetical protein